MQLQNIESKIYEVRGLRVMLDFDLADLNEVETKALNQALKRNIKRFPPKFVFQLTSREWETLRSQIVTASDQRKRNINALPHAFTEHGVTMLASVLRSDSAIQMNIAIIEAFIALRRFSMNYELLVKKLQQLERKYDKQFDNIFEALNHLLEKEKKEEEQKNRKRIGYK